MMCALALMSACSNDEKEIREVAYNYSYALANYKIEDATQYCTKETQETSLAYGLELMKGVSAEYIASDTPATIEIEGIEMTSDTTATAQYHKRRRNNNALTNSGGLIAVMTYRGLVLAYR